MVFIIVAMYKRKKNLSQIITFSVVAGNYVHHVKYILNIIECSRCWKDNITVYPYNVNKT